MKFEVKYRDCTSRVGKLSLDDTVVITPAIAWISTPTFTPPDFASLVVARDDTKTTKPTLQDQGSFFSPLSSPCFGDLIIPPSLIYPSSLPGDIHRHAATINYLQKGECCIVLDNSLDDLPLDAHIYILANSRKLFSQPHRFSEILVSLRKKIGDTKLIYTPGVGEPHQLALLHYCTVDLTDSFPLIWRSLNNYFLTTNGPSEIPLQIPCSCPACQKPGPVSFDDLLLHNYYAAHNEIQNIHNAIQNNTLRELVESRAHPPDLFSLLYLLDKEHYPFQEERFPITGHKLWASPLYLDRPDVKRFRIRVTNRFSKPPSAHILVLLPCSARKPYSQSRSHALFQQSLKNCGNPHVIHEVMVTSPLGLVPRELELVYPAGHYDIPVTGYWTHDEQAMLTEAFTSFLLHNQYDTIISHLPPHIHTLYPNEFLHTCIDHPTSSESLDMLTHTLQETVAPYPHVAYSKRVKENMACLLQYQFGPRLSPDFLKDSIIKGKYPFLKIFHNSTQLGMLVPERGLISLTLEGAQRISQSPLYWVEIDDFMPHGSIFATGVCDADPEIRIGDEVIVRHQEEVRAVGVAVMNAPEMIQSTRGEAVKIRHYKKD